MKLAISWRSLSSLVPAAAVLLATSTSAAAAGNITQLPFAAGLAISEYVMPTPGTPCSASATISGSGASTFGLLSFTSQDCIVFTSATSSTFSSSGAVLQTLSGDQIHVVYGGTAVSQAGGPLVLSGTYRFTGGTGAFKNASGCGKLHGVEDISTNPGRGFVVLTEGICP